MLRGRVGVAWLVVWKDGSVELKSVRIQNYRSIEDSGIVPIGEITCLVGKNESGKTAFLQALHLLNPLNPIGGKTDFDDVMDFPSRRFSAYRKVREESPAVVVTAVFELSDNELKIIEQDLGDGVLSSREISVVRGYAGSRGYRAEYVEGRAVEHMVSGIEMAATDRQAAESAATIPELVDALRAIEEPHSSVSDLIARIESWRKQSLTVYLLDNYFEAWLPKFFYFSEYSTMRGRVSLPDLKAKEASGLADEADRTFLSLLQTANADLNDFEVVDFEELIRELEGVANGITDDAFTYWRQNPGLRVVIQMSPGNPDDEPPLNRGPVVNLRIYNPKHAVTVPFDERSRGFVWFFSFYAYFSNIAEHPRRRTILLLDEPGLSLHATGQRDVLAFIEHELAQTLVTGQHCLLVEGPSDLLYLQLLSQACRDAGLCALDPRWVVTPVGGADKVSAFAGLHGSAARNVAVLIDAGPRDQQRIKALQGGNRLDAKSLIQISDFVAGKEADIEDLFAPAFYCAIVSGAYAKDLPGTLKPTDLKSRLPRITARVDQYFKNHDIACGAFSRYRSAAYFLCEQQSILPTLNTATLKRAAKMFERINSCLT